MSAIAASPVIETGDITIQPNAGGVPQFFTLYTLTGSYVERVESVFMQIAFESNTAQNSVFAIQLRAPDGKVLYEQPSPPCAPPNNIPLTVTFTWARLGNDSAQSPLFVLHSSTVEPSLGWCVMRLPDTVLQALSSVVLVAYIDDGMDVADPYIATEVAVTTTRNAGPASGDVTLDLTPYLLPTDNS